MAKRIVCWGGTELFTSEVKTTSDRSPVVALKEGECLSAAIRLPSVVAIERHWHRWRWFAFWVEVSKIITSTLPIRELMGRCCGIFLAKSEQNWMLPYSLSSSLNYFNWSIARSRSYHSIPYKNNPWICFDDTFFPQFCGYVLRNLTTESQKRHALSWKKKNNNENGIMKMTQNELRSIKITFPFGSHHYLVYFLSKCQHTTTKEHQTHDVEWPNVTNTSIEPKQTHNFSLVIIDKKKSEQFMELPNIYLWYHKKFHP